MEEKHCKWYNDEFCTNGDSPCVADYCPVAKYPELCKHRGDEFGKDINVRSKTELTYEEIVKDMIAHKEAAEIYSFVQITANQMSRWLDLIHRLQSEISGYVADQGILLREIERLTEERDKAKCDNTSLLYNVSRVEKENAELQKQVDELKQTIIRLHFDYDPSIKFDDRKPACVVEAE